MLADRTVSAVPEESASATSPIAVPLRLRVAPGLSAGLSLPGFDVALEREKANLGRELGLPFPGLKLSVDDTLSGSRYAIDVQEVQASQGDLQNGKVLAFAAREAGTNGGARPSPADTLAAHIAWVVRRHADSFIGMQETHELLTRAATQLPDLAAEVQKAVPLQRIADVLRRLVQEGVSIRYLREIFESLVVWSARENDIVMLTEYIRVDLGRFIVPRYVDGKNQLRAIVLDADAEKALREAIQQAPSGSFLALAPETAQALTAGAESALSRVGSADGGAVVLGAHGRAALLEEVSLVPLSDLGGAVVPGAPSQRATASRGAARIADAGAAAARFNQVSNFGTMNTATIIEASYRRRSCAGTAIVAARGAHLCDSGVCSRRWLRPSRRSRTRGWRKP